MTKKLKRCVLATLKLLGVFYLCRHCMRNKIVILCYHGVWLGDSDYKGDALFISPTTFISRMELINKLKLGVLNDG
jgi:hypothetical protein